MGSTSSGIMDRTSPSGPSASYITTFGTPLQATRDIQRQSAFPETITYCLQYFFSCPASCLNLLLKFAEALRNRICLSRRHILPSMPRNPSVGPWSWPACCACGSPRRRASVYFGTLTYSERREEHGSSEPLPRKSGASGAPSGFGSGLGFTPAM